jgi:hypothetical protein
MTRLRKNTVFTISLVILSLFLFSCSKKEKLTALIVGPVISAVATSNITSSGLTITWTTDVASSSKVYYGTTTSFASSTTEKDTGSSRTKNHSVTLSGLTANTLYYYYVVSKDVSSNTSLYGDDGSLDFTTGAQGPTISSVAAATTTTSATITWTTDTDSTTKVFYGTSATAMTTETTENTTMTKNHSQTLPGLSAGTYYYYVYSKDASNNSSTSGSDGSKSFTISSTPTGTTFNLYLDDIQLIGTAGTTLTFYDDAVNSSSTLWTGGTNNFAYMGSAPNGSAPDINSMDFSATDEKHSGTASWKIVMSTGTSTSWDGEYALASGAFRTNWTGSEVAGDESGPTGTVTLHCWAKVTGITSTKITIGIGDDSAYTSAANIESIGTVGSKSSCKKSSNATSINSTGWTEITVSLGNNPNLTAMNGLFLWSMAMSDVHP